MFGKTLYRAFQVDIFPDFPVSCRLVGETGDVFSVFPQKRYGFIDDDPADPGIRVRLFPEFFRVKNRFIGALLYDVECVRFVVDIAIRNPVVFFVIFQQHLISQYRQLFVGQYVLFHVIRLLPLQLQPLDGTDCGKVSAILKVLLFPA